MRQELRTEPLTRRAIESRHKGPPAVTRSNVLTLKNKDDNELDLHLASAKCFPHVQPWAGPSGDYKGWGTLGTWPPETAGLAKKTS